MTGASKDPNGNDGRGGGGAALPEAARDHLAAAEAGDAVAQYRVGFALAHAGRTAEAVPWYRRSAEGGEDYAQYALAIVLMQGEVVARDPVEAAKWFERAAEQGDDISMTWLGAIHRDGGAEGGSAGMGDGKGVPVDPATAWMWFELAARCGDAGAPAERERVGERMSSDEIAGAADRADVWEARFLPGDD